MPRNSGQRLSAQDAGGETPPPQDVNSLLDFVIPTEFVELPTKGKFYSKDHPLHNVEAVEIRYMTAKDTDILTSKTLLKRGIAIDRMLENVIVDKRVKIKDLFVGDKNAIVVATRIGGFGEDYEANISCPSCGKSEEQVFNLSEIAPKESEIEIEFSEDGTFFIELPQTKINVECRLLTTQDENNLTNKTEKKQKLGLPESSLTDQYKSFIVSLNGVTEQGVVDEFVNVMPARDAHHLKKEYETARPDVDFRCTYECSNCGAISKADIPFTTNFFWPN